MWGSGWEKEDLGDKDTEDYENDCRNPGYEGQDGAIFFRHGREATEGLVNKFNTFHIGLRLDISFQYEVVGNNKIVWPVKGP